MATRPVFISERNGPALVRVMPVEFVWHAGMAKSRRQMSTRSLHEATKRTLSSARMLEVSRMSEDPVGERLSAFNLTFHTKERHREIAVESAFQASKVFESGGPYLDLLDSKPIDAKRDDRLQRSGNLIGFSFFGQKWELEPQTAFYDWVYINALHLKPELAVAVMAYDVFTDIAFNPDKSINCQAGAVALYVSLRHRGKLEQALSSRESYMTVITGAKTGSFREGEGPQGRLF
ncbi:hypothetical protein ACC786_36095 [Rhizobium ruizarguesonis]|uniref:DarT1-associated NADAR antitoxin family protein n=1 Tax=Rhizobium TaxID=379 RepID=UPI0010319C3E|nr:MULTISPECIES: hypothetical protein [Rhizobium]MBY3202006.1 hypothetical protein [Rhizobium laguerreae]TAY91919.1 hypothetical protein ELH85_01240 [Rhizobium ruizarguesonis]